MRKSILYLFAFVFAMHGWGQPPNYFYTILGGAGDDVGYSVKETFGRQYIVIGTTSSYGSGLTDAYMLLIDSMGQRKWEKTFGGAQADVGKSVVVNPIDSGFVFAGYTSSFGTGGYDIYVVRTDKRGSLIWEVTFGGFDWDFGNDLLISSDNNVIVCGSTYSSGRGKMDGKVLKVDITNGKLIWEKSYGGVENDEFKAIYSSNGVELFLVGNTQSFGEINGDVLMYKLNSAGDSIMRITYGGNLFDGANSVVDIANGDILVAGSSESYTSGKKDAFIVKFTAGGIVKWRKNFGLSQFDEECYKIIRSASPVLEESIIIYTTQEDPGSKRDVKTIFLNYDGDYYGGYDSGKFGFSENDEAFDISACKDKGYVQVGYTSKVGYLDKDIFFIKQDSLLEEWQLVVGLKENEFKSNYELRIYPNPISDDTGSIWFDFGSKEGLLDSKVLIYNSCGKMIYSFEPKGNLKFSVPVAEWASGIYFVKVTNGKLLYDCKIIKN
ncbi:MAG: T9SS type A sorting domain-containing protein [bacterium]|nr:T9SS type A sorting domain-containing protein [bacterium]